MGSKADQQRFETLWREHRGIVLKVAGVYARSAEERLDLAQEIGAQLWRSFAGYDERRAKFSTWLYRIALNVAISHLRRTGGEAGRFEPLIRKADFSLDAFHADPEGVNAKLMGVLHD